VLRRSITDAQDRSARHDGICRAWSTRSLYRIVARCAAWFGVASVEPISRREPAGIREAAATRYTERRQRVAGL
jgi:hypothetical protein